MRKDKYKYQIGDILYEASTSYVKVFAWKIVDIFVENYVGGPKVVFRVERDTENGWIWARDRYLSDIQMMYDTQKEAEEELNEWKKTHSIYNFHSAMEDIFNSI